MGVQPPDSRRVLRGLRRDADRDDLGLLRPGHRPAVAAVPELQRAAVCAGFGGSRREQLRQRRSFAVGQSIHFINGIVFGLWFALVVYNKIPTFFAKMKSIQKGLLFAIVQTIISTGFLFPYVYARKAGFGVFSFGDNVFGTNHDHWKLPFAILLWHLIWGGILGYLYDPKRPDEVRVVEVRA